MKYVILSCLITLIQLPSYSQEKELTDFKNVLNLFIDLRLGKIDSLALNEANQVKYSKKTDEAFKLFVAHPNSYSFEEFVVARNDASTKFFYADRRIYITLKTFPVNGKTYVVYSYSSQDKKNYFIKELESNTVVYEGNSNCCYIDHLYGIDSTHFLLIEKDGDMNSSRTSIVLSAKKQPWAKTKSFEGMAFGQVESGYFTKKYVNRREAFQLDCNIDIALSAPADINDILYDPKTRTISYKQYLRNKTFKLITAKWENACFKIDDYSVSENLSGQNTMMQD